MKKIVFVTGLSLLTIGSFAQMGKVMGAYNYLQYNDLDKAKNSIDLATVHEKSKSNAKTWLYRGKVYYAIHVSKEEKFKTLHDNPLKEAYTAYLKAFEFDTKKIDIKDLQNSLAICVPSLFSAGVESFNSNSYPDAVEKFETCISIGEKLGTIDTLAAYNAALASERGEMNDKALKYYQKCADLGYGGASVYSSMAAIHKAAGDEVAALAVLKKGREKHPDNQDMITAEINFYLKDGKYDEAFDNLSLAIKNDPNNATFYFARASINDQRKQYEEAKADYIKAIELKPDYFDALYNLGALYFNQGAETNNQANDLPLNEAKKGEELRAKADELFKGALPHLEKAHELNSSDKNTMVSLKNIYARTGDTEKYKVINEKLTN